MQEFLNHLTHWLAGSGVRIALIIIGALAVTWLVNLLIEKMGKLKSGEEDSSPESIETQKRIQTVSGLFRKVVKVAVYTVALMMILAELGLNITPIIAGAGIVGLAVGFGAQNLVRDVISGLFLILENQVRVGDVARINGTGGLVEEINLRTIVLRDIEGTVHVFPNGTIESLSNMSKEWSRFAIDVGVAYKENIDEVMELLKKIGEGLAKDARFGEMILEPLEVLGVDGFGGSEVVIKCVMKTAPAKQWEVGRELRRRIKNTFDERGIEIPFPHVSLYVGEETKPLPLSITGGDSGLELNGISELSSAIKSLAEKRGKTIEEILSELVAKASDK